MVPYLAKRLLAMIPTLLGITLITFLIINMAPGDPVAATVGSGGGGDEGGGGGGKEKAALAIKAKKQLLGILSKDVVVRAWPAAAPPREKADRAPELPIARRIGAFAEWPRSMAVGSDGALYVATESGAVAAVDAATGEATRAFAGHSKSVWALAVSRDGKLLASGDVDGVVLTWRTSDGTRVAEFPAVGTPIRDLAFLPDGRLLSACEDGDIRVHDGASLAVVGEIKEHTGFVAALAVSSDGARFWSGGFDRRLREWDARSLAAHGVIGRHGQSITDIALSKDGARLATSCDDRVVRVFDVSKTGNEPPVVELVGHYKEATTVAMSADGRTVWSGSKDETIRTWDAATGEQTAQSGAVAVGKVFALVVSPDGTEVWSASESWTKTPLVKRYLRWLGKIVTFDFDRSFLDERRVIDKMAEALPVTLGLNFLAIALIYLVSIPLGVAAAVKRGSAFDTVSSIVLFLLSSIPSFWLGTILITRFSSERAWNVLPCVGLHAIEADQMSYLSWLADWGKHLVLPLVVLTYAGFGSLSRYVRTSMLETIAQDYVRTARAKGLPERIVVYKHAFRNSLVTIVTLVANLLPFMIGGSVIIEFIFTINGMGLLGFQAIQERDYPVIMAITTFSALLTLLGILLSDVLYTIVDPRITHS